MRIGIIRFPGANCDADCLWAFGTGLGQEAEYVWHKEERLPRAYDLIVLPGGFSFGDYLRPGAIARFSPVMGSVIEHAAGGGLLLGICNGFQVLTEAGLLPGSLARNRRLAFISRDVQVRVEHEVQPWTHGLPPGRMLTMPIAHHDGAFTASPAVLAELNEYHQVLLRYAAPQGQTDPTFNPNGSDEAIAGIRNRAGNVFGLMPHPERAMALPRGRAIPQEGQATGMPLGSSDGRTLLTAMLGLAEVAA